MEMIEILGYIFLHLIIGVLLLPFLMLIDIVYEFNTGKRAKTSKKVMHFVVLVWPVSIIIVIFVLWFRNWEYYKHYK